MLLKEKKGLICGVANKRSIAWAIAQSCAREGAKLAFTFQGERLEENVRELSKSIPGSLLFPCDVGSEEQVKATFAGVRAAFGELDFLVHSIAFAPKEALEGEFVNTGREAFKTALDVSAYSLALLSREAAPLMQANGGSIVTLTYLGSERVIPNYNVMGVAKAALEATVRYLASDLGSKGIRVNAISAGPIKTLSASGVSGFSTILDHIASKSPLRRNVEAAEVGDAAAFMLSPLSRGITGQVLFVDSGYHVMGM